MSSVFDVLKKTSLFLQHLKENDDRCLHEAAQWSEKIEGYGSIKYVCVK